MQYELVKKDYRMKLDNIGCVAVDSKDNVYLAIRAPSTPIVIFDKDGEFIGGMGTGLKVANSHGIHVDAMDNVFLVDCGRHVVHKFSAAGELLMTIGQLDKPAVDSGAINGDYKTIRRGGGAFYSPTKVATSGSGDIYVTDGYANSRVHRFSKDGELILSWGEPGFGPGEFHIVHGVSVDPDTDDVYVCDRENMRIQVFDNEGHVKSIWSDLWRPTDVHVRGDFVYVAELGELLLTDNVMYDLASHRHHSRIRVFDKAGREIAELGTEDGGRPGSFLAAHGVCADSRGDVYGCEVNNWSIQNAMTAWPNGVGAPTGMHPGFQKFRRTDLS